MAKIGLIGKGFVGEAFYEGMKNHHIINVWDVIPEKRTVETYQEFVSGCNLFFVCVPTPMNQQTGQSDTSIVEAVVKNLSEQLHYLSATVVIKSTVPPGTTERLANTYANLQFIFNPEFLTEKNYIDDFINQDRIVLGNTSLTFDRNLTTVIDTYLEAFPGVPVVITDSTTAEMVKYLANIYLATKVTFANEMKEICDGVGTSYDEVVKIAKLDKRLGDSHWQVPGPDGKRGFGGTCFPKDINALRAVCRDLYIDTPFLNAVWRKNLDVRPERDWEESKGRAVS